MNLCGSCQITLHGGRHIIYLSGGRHINLCGGRHIIIWLPPFNDFIWWPPHKIIWRSPYNFITLNYYLMWHYSLSVRMKGGNDV